MSEEENAKSALAWMREQAKQLNDGESLKDVSDCARLISGHIYDGSIEKRVTKSWILGQSSGLEEASKILMKEASDLFVRYKESEAKLLRDLASDLEKKSKERGAECDSAQ